MLYLDKELVEKCLSYQTLIKELQKGFASDFHMPARQVFELKPGCPEHNAFAVLPAWNDQVIGVKAFTYFPKNNEKAGLKSLYSNIMLFSRETGEPLVILDGGSITYWRTACVSALAADYLSNKNSSHLLFLGTGNLAPYMINAHLAVRDYKKVSIWGRDKDKSQSLVDHFSHQYPNIQFQAVAEIEPEARKADVISAATGANEPLILGDWLKPGCHVDLVGNHNRDYRECDSTAIVKSRVFADSKINVMKEAGELLIPIDEGLIKETHLVGELSDLTKGAEGRLSETDVTLFKSVGTALSDLLAANLVFNHSK